MANLDSLSAAQIAAGVRNGDFTATEVARAALDAIDSREKDVQAYLQVSADLALEAAERTDARRAAGEKIGPLAGVPVAFKDNMHLVGTRTTCASKMLENYESVFTATCVQRMLDAGATPVGKANMDEFAFGSTTESSAFHRTNNPWDTSRVPGGSSGGSAAAVAAGEATLALGSDTGGSIRQPASFCGVVGMKPTYGAVSRYGVVAFGSSLDQVGPFGRRVEDVALAMNALTAPGRDPLDSTSQDCAVDFLEHLDDPVEGLSVGVVPQLMEAKGLSQEVRDALAATLDSLRDQGARVVEVDLPNIASAIAAYYVIAPCEAFSNLARFDGVRYGYQEPDCATLAQQTSLSRAHGFGEEAKRRQMLGAYLLSSGVYEKYYYPAQQVRTLITQDYARAYQSCDVILLPSAPTTAWRFGDVSDPTQMYASDMFTISNNICGNGGVSVPLGLSAQTHMPVSAQLQGPAFSDRRLLRFARAIERGVDQGLGLGGGAPVAPAFAGRGGDL
ncbi:MAG: Asp-tRNA(Asn)/Glu-tRNA(Gln) amidotransferase subunit GatA [Parafannyhessea umbonata]|uniref:Asp-tRNA(Asn)/Glu-tRNA(Gln) amidotransferase subunit GatA n=1 Tax=Parafannyhessea umbonata TaxID=604330 RepID=UPI0026E9D266|nr:Asp-tRNA(Asn)/Glu-tRNA(Gln) amidotransferase subunit GatA [Parafannyhessea umbonata]MCI6682185.1 Asp-tRNA(Asn)/Glu-tRNA(Gln) amidotransferase subunit GatA [Parafannyhessea umbonata]MCI7219263.1 Asp-tRNA(Asn)/Glu-tRNA(Gln) amidotransferase subunit GatA [Parafannyhessea umbonata]MDD6358425.1 Asp-tRNA(Asn)/Glu-tRNA(Gln) amidotransferase subunit GatA [Parafannyhessea umbonata]MDD6602103.1 Asp-tRNA(Asn)/Glu-tRNA(Gln) amidotransferase subunit GatA [Parafannyhessea umbonata]